MKVSVVIPAHNEEKYISETLKAILNQHSSDFEVIVVCNACTDRTEEVSRGFPVKVLVEPKLGVQGARERGRLAASGEIIASLDADCRPHPDWLRLGTECFNNPKIVAVTGPYIFFDVSPVFKFFSLLIQKIFYKFIHQFLAFFHAGAILIGGNCLLRNSALEKIGGYDTSILFYGDDTNTARRLSKVGRIIYSNDLTMATSARRFSKEGLIKIFFTYIYYFAKETF